MFAYAKKKTQISCAVTAQLISAFVFASQIEPSILFLHPVFKLLPLFCDCADQFLSDLVGNLEDWFSRVVGLQVPVDRVCTFCFEKLSMALKREKKTFSVLQNNTRGLSLY